MASERGERLTAAARRAQLIEVGRSVFAKRGFEAASVEEIAARAKVSKPIVYEPFGGKEGLYAVIVDREVEHIVSHIVEAMSTGLSAEAGAVRAGSRADYRRSQRPPFATMRLNLGRRARAGDPEFRRAARGSVYRCARPSRADATRGTPANPQPRGALPRWRHESRRRR